MLEHMAYFWNRMGDYKILLNNENAPLHVELSIFIESHFKFTIMSFKLIIRLSFGLKLQNLPGRPLEQPQCALDFSDEKTAQYLNFRGCIELHDWKGI